MKLLKQIKWGNKVVRIGDRGTFGSTTGQILSIFERGDFGYLFIQTKNGKTRMLRSMKCEFKI